MSSSNLSVSCVRVSVDKGGNSVFRAVASDGSCEGVGDGPSKDEAKAKAKASLFAKLAGVALVEEQPEG